jgi:hypothetical protein
MPDYDLSSHNPPVPSHFLVVICVRAIASARRFYSMSPRQHAKLAWAEAFAGATSLRDACERDEKCKENALGSGQERSWFMNEAISGGAACSDGSDCINGNDSSCSSCFEAEPSTFKCSGASYVQSLDPEPVASSDIVVPSLHLSREASGIGSPFYRLHLDLPMFLNAADFHLVPDTMYAYHVHADASGTFLKHQEPLEFSAFATSPEHYFMIRRPPTSPPPLRPPSCRQAPCGATFATAWRLDADTKIEKTKYSSIQPNGSHTGEHYFIRGVNGYESTRAFLLPQLDPFCSDGTQPQRSGLGDGGKYLCLNDVGSSSDGSINSDGSIDVIEGNSSSSSNNNSCLIYSIGSDNNFDFEKSAYAATGCDIHTFDCTVANATNKPPFVHFHPWCLGRGHMSLMEVIVALGHDNRDISLLKMDCEGCEWAVFSHYRAFVSSGSLRRIRQLSFELHVSSFAAGVLQQFLDMFQWFYASNYRVISWEPNGWGCTEYSLLLDERCGDVCSP